MVQSVRRERVRQLIDGGAQVVEVLERRQYELAHLPGALHIPAWELTRERSKELDPSRPVLLYCFDTLWDLSPRAACLLELYGFTDVYDYVDGKVDWMAYGLPVEGQDGPFIGERVSPVATCEATQTVGEARRLGADVVVVVAGGGLAVGEVDADTLEQSPDDHQLLDVMDPVPSTYRPSVTEAALAEEGGGRHLVSTSDGRLLGEVTVEEGAHEHAHDHDDVDMDQFEQELTGVMEAVRERFGDREPTEEELRALLHERLMAEGRSAEDADRFLDQLRS